MSFGRKSNFIREKLKTDSDGVKQGREDNVKFETGFQIYLNIFHRKTDTGQIIILTLPQTKSYRYEK